MWKSLLLYRYVGSSLRLAFRLFLDRRVPFRLKLLLPAAIAYLVMPIDLLPDFFPLLGRIDDVLVLLVALLLFLSLSPTAVVREHLSSMKGISQETEYSRSSPDSKGKVIEGSYHFVDDPEDS